MRKLHRQGSEFGFSSILNGLINLHDEKYHLALKDFDAAVRASPGNFFYYERRACTKIVLGDAKGAIEDVNAFLSLFNPVYGQLDDRSCLVVKCCCLLLNNQLTEALIEMRKFHQYTIDYKIVAYLKGLTLIKLKNYDESLKAFNFATEDPERKVYGVLPIRLQEHALDLMKSISIADFDSAAENGIVRVSDWKYMFSNVWEECCEASNHSKKIRNNANDNWHLPPILNERTCNRCQMTPCHCSDPDWN